MCNISVLWLAYKRDVICTREIKSVMAIVNSALCKKKVLFSRKFNFNLRKKLLKYYIWSIVFYGAESWTPPKEDQKYLESFRTRCWRRMEKMSWTDHMRNEEILHRIKEERNILQTIKGSKCKWIGQILSKICLLKRVIKGKTGEKTRKKT